MGGKEESMRWDIHKCFKNITSDLYGGKGGFREALDSYQNHLAIHDHVLHDKSIRACSCARWAPRVWHVQVLMKFGSESICNCLAAAVLTHTNCAYHISMFLVILIASCF